MTVELITGYSGTPHIGSDDVQHLIAGIVGGGSYALDTGKKLAIAVNSANSVTVDTGDAIIAGGAHVRVAAAEKLTVTSGAQGVKRNDLVCLRYTKASDNKESAALVVVKGTATSGTPADPAVNTGSIIDGKATVDMPLYRLPLDGVSLGTPVKLFNVSPTLASLGDSVSQDSGWKTAGTDYVSIKYRKVCGIVFVLVLNITCTNNSDVTNHGVVLPSGYRPSEDAEPYFPIGYMSQEGYSGMCKIYADGSIASIGGPHHDYYYSGYVAYPAEG